MQNQESFGILLGEFLDRAIMAFDDLSVATEQFIDKTVTCHLVDPHAADAKRLKQFNLSLGDLMGKNEKEKESKPNSESKSEKHQVEKTEHSKHEQKIENTEAPTELENVNNSQENSQRHRKRRRHHQEQQQE